MGKPTPMTFVPAQLSGSARPSTRRGLFQMRGVRAWLILLAVLPVLAGCPRHVPRAYPEPRPEEILAHVRGIRERAHTLRAETLSDARIGDQRANVTVLILAEWGGNLRFMAMNPNGAMAADLAANAERFCTLDANANCGECGPPTPENVASLIRIPLEPDDVVATMFGTTPVLAGARASVRWDAANGHEIVELVDARGYRQTLVVDGVDRRWDVLDSALRSPEGKQLWRIRHKDFHAVKSAGDPAGVVRLPGKSLFEQPGDSVLIRWRQQELNVPLDATKFQLDVPAGLPACVRRR